MIKPQHYTLKKAENVKKHNWCSLKVSDSMYIRGNNVIKWFLKVQDYKVCQNDIMQNLFPHRSVSTGSPLPRSFPAWKVECSGSDAVNRRTVFSASLPLEGVHNTETEWY